MRYQAALLPDQEDPAEASLGWKGRDLGRVGEDGKRALAAAS